MAVIGEGFDISGSLPRAWEDLLEDRSRATPAPQ